MKVQVIKRNKEKVPLDISKWQQQIGKVCEGVDEVSQSMIEIKAQPQFYNGITTKEIDEITLRAMVDLIDIESNPDIGNVNYQYVAGKQKLSMLRKDVYGKYEPDTLYSIVVGNVKRGLYTDELLSWYTEDEWNQMDKFIDHKKDEKYSYSAIEQLVEKYLVKNRATGQVYETPQIRYMVASATAHHREDVKDRMKYIKEYYESASNGEFTLATPVLAGLGTPTKQFSSCFPAGQKVWTPTGQKNIESVVVGDTVMANDGTYQKIVATREIQSGNKKIININNVYSLNDEFSSTEDHLIMALKRNNPNSRKKYSVPEWVRADAVEKGDFVQIPYNSYVFREKYISLSEMFPTVLDVLTLCDDGILRKKATDILNRSGEYDDKVADFADKVNLSPELFRLIGYYLAEGHSNKETYSVGFTVSSKETYIIEDITQIISKEFGLHTCINVKSDNSTTILVNSCAFLHLMKGLCGTGFDKKYMHDILMRGDFKLQKQLLIGVIRGDGCVTKNGLSLGMSNRNLIIQLSQIMLRCGLSPVLGVLTADKINEYKINRWNKFPTTTEKKIYTKQDNYKITLGLAGNIDFLRSVGKNNKLDNVSVRLEQNFNCKRINGMYFAKVTSINAQESNNCLVYDLQVDNVHSFTVNGIGVHNCVLIKADDNLDSIFAAGEVMAKYAAKRAGIGLDVGALRRIGSPIRGGEIKHTGHIPFLKKWFGDLRSCSQGGIRNSSATVFYPIWHYNFPDLIVLKNNQGTEETRVRHMDYGVVLSNLFLRRYKEGGDVTLFDPNEVPELYDAYYKDIEKFNKLYVEYEKRKDLKTIKISADELFTNGVFKQRTDTGRIYLVDIDNVQKQGSFDTENMPIYQSNLCLEILLPTKGFNRIDDITGKIALCTLGSINLGAFKKPEDMRRAARVLHRSLNNILDYQDFLTVQSKASNEEIRPIGIGITNLAYFFAKRGLKYGEPDSLQELKKWMEHLAYYTTESSVELAKERGACEKSSDTYYGKGVFPWERRNPNVDELTDFTPSLDWEPLRKDMLQYGVRNATQMAVAPVESSSVVINSTNGIEMPMSLITIKDSKAGVLIQVVPEYNKLKNKYELMWEQTDCINYIKTSAVIAAFVDQSISTNTYYNPANYKDKRIPATVIAKNIMLGFRWGIKTFYYSIMNKVGSKEVEVKDIPVVVELEDDSDCESCKL